MGGVESPVCSEFQGYMQAAHVNCGLSCLCPGGRRVNNPWGALGFRDLHSSDRINADTVVLTLEGNCQFQPLKLKLGRLKRHSNDMGTLMAALVKYADSDSTKDPESDDDKTGKGKKSGNAKGSTPTRRVMETAASVKRTTV